MTLLITGGAGFIGSNFVLDWLAQSDEPVVNLDALTYAGNLQNLAALQGDARHVFVQGDIGDRALLDSVAAPSAMNTAPVSPKSAMQNAFQVALASAGRPESSAWMLLTTALTIDSTVDTVKDLWEQRRPFA